MTDEELRVWAMDFAMELRGDFHWKHETIVKLANKFYRYFKTGEWTDD